MRKLVAALFLATFVACGGDSVTDVNASIAGTYTLRTVNGSPLPYVFPNTGTDKVEIIDDAVTVTDAGTYTEVGHARLTSGTSVTTQVVTDNGTYTRTGTAVSFRSVDGTVSSGSVSGSSITIADVGLSLLYQK